jgi:ankyrin repeat protein
MVKLLLEMGADARTSDDNGASALMMAAWAGQLATVKVLLAHVVKHCPEVIAEQGVTPMTSACGGRGPHTAAIWAERKGYTKIASLLSNAML